MRSRGIAMDESVWELVDHWCAREGVSISEFFRRAACRVLMRPDLRREVNGGEGLLSPEERSERSQKGGKARAEKLSPERRSEIARNAARVRWSS